MIQSLQMLRNATDPTISNTAGIPWAAAQQHKAGNSCIRGRQCALCSSPSRTLTSTQEHISKPTQVPSKQAGPELPKALISQKPRSRQSTATTKWPLVASVPPSLSMHSAANTNLWQHTASITTGKTGSNNIPRFLLSWVPPREPSPKPDHLT